jgi:hypothetical protein
VTFYAHLASTLRTWTYVTLALTVITIFVMSAKPFG